MRLKAFLFALIIATPVAKAAVIEVPLQKRRTQRTGLPFRSEGSLWVALDCSWAIGHIGPGTNETHLCPLGGQKANDMDTMWALRVAPDDSLWTPMDAYIQRHRFLGCA